tara:strand:+ start:310 stop:462 length:153 start_codon:yes stop_codon:yes gene_type:complete
MLKVTRHGDVDFRKKRGRVGGRAMWTKGEVLARAVGASSHTGGENADAPC